jgi:hypothetical protein
VIFTLRILTDAPSVFSGIAVFPLRRKMMTLDAVEGLHAGSGASARLKVGGYAIRRASVQAKSDVVTVKKVLGTIEQAVGKWRFGVVNAEPRWASRTE